MIFRFVNSNEFLPKNFDPTGINPESPLLGGNTYQSRFIQIGNLIQTHREDFIIVHRITMESFPR